MNSLISRIAAAVPATAIILGFGIGAAEAAPEEVTDHSQVQPKPDWNDVVIDDLDSGDPEDEPEDPPADPPADEPADHPAEDDGADADEESDEESDQAAEDEGTDSPANPVPAFDAVKTSSGSDENRDASEGETVEAFQTTAAELTPPSHGATGVHVPVLVVVAGGAMVAGVAGWAGYRRHRIFAS